MKRKNVYVLGDARGVYRIQNFIKFLVDRPKQYGLIFDNRRSNKRPLKYIKSFFCDPIRVLGSNIVYVNILNVDVDIIYSMLLAKLFRKKIIVDYYISIYEKVVIDEGWFKEKSFLGKLAKKLDRFYYNCATKVIFLNECQGKHCCELSGINRKHHKEEFISLCAEETLNVEYKKINNRDKFVICWWGSYLPLHGLKYIIEAAKIIKNMNLPIKWYFFGNSEEKGRPYVDLVKEYGLQDVCNFENKFTMRNGKLQKFLNENCDLAMGNFGDSPKAKFVITNKVIDACSMKIPILTGKAIEYGVYFDGINDLYMCDNDPQEIANVINDIFNADFEELVKHANKCYDIYKDNFTVELYTSKLEKILEK